MVVEYGVLVLIILFVLCRLIFWIGMNGFCWKIGWIILVMGLCMVIVLCGVREDVCLCL